MPRQERGEPFKKTIRVPLAGNAQQRATNQDKDQRFINYLFETTKNVVTETKKLFCVKRPGTVEYSYPPAGAAVGRGVWYFNGAVWSVFGQWLYKNSVFKQTLTTSTGMCGATQFVNTDDYSKPALFLADGTDAWVIDSSDTVTRVDTRYLQWTASTIVEVGDRRANTALDKWFTCITAGTTGAAEPAWTTGADQTDGTAHWKYEAVYSGTHKRANLHAYVVGDEIILNPETSQWFKCTTAGTSAAAPPTFNTAGIGDVTTDGTAVFEYKGEYGGFPSPHIPTPVEMDGYIFLAKDTSIDIYNSGIAAPYSWSTLDFASAESFPDPIVGLARQNNYVVAFGTESTEFMYNYAKANQITTGVTSPLDRYEQLVQQTGNMSANAVLQNERTVMYIGDSNMAGHAVWRMDGTQAREISTEYIEKFIDLETPTSGVTGFGVRMIGHILYVINLPTANRTFVYDLEENMWSEWQYNGGLIPFIAFCDANGVMVIQHKTNGKLYKFDPLVYNDFDCDITARIRLSKQDFDTDSYKFFQQTTVIGDTSQHSDILRWSDDDYTTWSGDKTLTAGDRPYFMRSGKARRRAWELEYTHNSPRRLEALEVTYSIGTH
jgi:hypothetical protein